MIRFWALLILLSGVVGVAQGPKPPANQEGSQRYRMVWTHDPSHESLLIWESLASDNRATKIFYDTTNWGTDFESYQFQTSVSKVKTFKGMKNAYASFKNLVADKTYYFVIASDAGTSRVLSFHTAPEMATGFTLIAGGDSRNNRVPRRNANMLVAKLKPLAVLFTGDFTSFGTSGQWAEWLDDWQLTISREGRLTPIIPARGNHEFTNDDLEKLFGLPEDNYYSLSIGPLLDVYALNTEISIGGHQRDWLRNDLELHRQTPWKIAFYHKPIRPHVRGKNEGQQQYDHWAPLFYKFGMSLVVEADAHDVKRSWPVIPSNGAGSEEGFVRNDKFGTVYIGEGCWGAPLRKADDNKVWTQASDSFNQLNWLSVSENSVKILTVKTDNAEIVENVPSINSFARPKNLITWKPNSGEILEINK